MLIVDFGSQTAHQIKRRLEEIGVPATLVLPSLAMDKIVEEKPTGVILSGGPDSVNEEGSPTIDPKLFTLGIPVLGICYGWQLMAKLLGGRVERSHAEFGPQTIYFECDLFALGKKNMSVIMSHGDTVVTLPSRFTAFGSTANIAFAAVADESQKFWGLQFHPEVSHTESGTNILKYFAFEVCLAKTKYATLNPDQIITSIKELVGEEESVICAVSGGVDSTVAGYLIEQAIGERFHPIYVESGLMRPGTREKVKTIFNNPTIIDAEDEFLAVLKGLEDPEEKRKAIGKLFIDLFYKACKDETYLAQGTIYSDLIESKGTIKSHHNVGGLPKDLPFKLLEPLAPFYKDQVRAIGRLVGLPKAAIAEHPFPGPGYAVRIRGEVTRKRLAQVKQADQIVMEEIEKAGLKEELFQCFALMTGAYSTAVKGDARVFAEVVAIRAYESTDVMTSTWAKLPYDLLAHLSNRIVNEVPDISRVVYDITSKPPATMEWE